MTVSLSLDRQFRQTLKKYADAHAGKKHTVANGLRQYPTQDDTEAAVCALIRLVLSHYPEGHE